ncbi:MAG TPA: MFS transporter, partial [Rhizorhapis sp.]|nr:MFS transporter [Rhizorhapis sp.]
FNLARSAGPAVGGGIVAIAGATAAFLFNVLSYIGLIAVLASWKPPVQERRGQRESMWEALGAGIRYVHMSKAIRRAVWRAFLFGLAASAIPATTPLIARDLMHGGPLTYGFLLGGFGIGAVGGALATRRLRARLSVEQIVRCGVIALAIGGTVSAVSPALPVTSVGIALAGAGWIVSLSTFNVTVQLDSPRWVVARTCRFQR